MPGTSRCSHSRRLEQLPTPNAGGCVWGPMSPHSVFVQFPRTPSYRGGCSWKLPHHYQWMRSRGVPVPQGGFLPQQARIASPPFPCGLYMGMCTTRGFLEVSLLEVGLLCFEGARLSRLPKGRSSATTCLSNMLGELHSPLYALSVSFFLARRPS